VRLSKSVTVILVVKKIRKEKNGHAAFKEYRKKVKQFGEKLPE